MDAKDLLSLLNNVVEENETESLNKHDRVLLIDGLNLFFRNFAMLNFVNEDGVHVGGLGGFLRSLGTLINRISRIKEFLQENSRIKIIQIQTLNSNFLCESCHSPFSSEMEDVLKYLCGVSWCGAMLLLDEVDD